MGTIKHSRASKRRWAGVPKSVRSQRMTETSNKGWGALDQKARRRRALKGVRTREKKKLEELNISHE